jgi:Sulfotransferase family
MAAPTYDHWPQSGALMQAARSRTGLTNFGGTEFVTGLDALLASLAAESLLEGEQRDRVLAMFLHRLENRLRVEAWHAAHPEASKTEVRGPIMVTGLPRTGTTALGNLLSLDAQLRPLRSWEQGSPLPPPVLATENDDPRRLASIERISTMMAQNPGQMAMHIWETDATEEDHDVLGMAFAGQNNILPVPGYRAWWRAADMRPAYGFHKRVLQVLQSSRPPNLWVLKAPHYKFHMEDIVAVYPDARFIFTHRDPEKTLSSYFSFAMTHYPPGSVETFGRERIARDIHQHLLEGMKTAVAARERLGEGSFVDVSQKALSADTFGTLRHVYDGLGLPFTADFEERVRAWHTQNHSGAHGEHRHSLEDVGFTAEQIRADFAFYTDKFAHLL